MEVSKNGPNVLQLWQRLQAMEDELRFDGKAYPDGMCALPFRLTGQGFFPGGDGLWRDEEELSIATDGALRQGGAVFLGNDFGAAESYKKLEKKSFENVPTWRHIKIRAKSADIPAEITFFTNAIMGLRTDGTALTQRRWETMRGFPEFCGEFLAFQLSILKPRLTVVMGPHAKAAFDAFADISMAGRVLYTSHPYADFGFTKERREADISELKAAWQEASQN
jgi:hypothetical protein